MNRNLSPEEFNASRLPTGQVGAKGYAVPRDSWYAQVHGVSNRLGERAEDIEVEASQMADGFDIMQMDDTSEAGEIRHTQNVVRGMNQSSQMLHDIADREEIIDQSSGRRRDPQRAWN